MRLIDADKLDEKLENLAKKYAAMGRFEVAKDYSWTQTVLLSAPTLTIDDIIPHGRWKGLNHEKDYWGFDSDGDFGCWSDYPVICTVCHYDLTENNMPQTAYCPNCGAKMLHDNPELIGGTE